MLDRKKKRRMKDEDKLRKREEYSVVCLLLLSACRYKTESQTHRRWPDLYLNPLYIDLVSEGYTPRYQASQSCIRTTIRRGCKCSGVVL